MRRLLATLIGVTIAVFATTASAYVVEITTSIPAATAADDADLKQALASAIDDVVTNAIAFTPTQVTLQQARRVGERIYLLLLVVDQDGEEMMKQLATEEDPATPDTVPEPGASPTDL